MIHNDTTCSSAERRNTLSFSVYLCVCRIFFFVGAAKKAKKTASCKGLSRVFEVNSPFLDARVLCHHHHAKRAFGITSQIRIKKTLNFTQQHEHVCFSFHVVLRGQRERVP